MQVRIMSLAAALAAAVLAGWWVYSSLQAGTERPALPAPPSEEDYPRWRAALEDISLREGLPRLRASALGQVLAELRAAAPGAVQDACGKAGISEEYFFALGGRLAGEEDFMLAGEQQRAGLQARLRRLDEQILRLERRPGAEIPDFLKEEKAGLEAERREAAAPADSLFARKRAEIEPLVKRLREKQE